MPRHDSPTDDLDPVVAEDLRRLEAALAGAESADPELLLLVEGVRADVATPAPAFRESLDARAAAGFPAARGPRAWAAALRAGAGGRRSFTLVPALGFAATMLIALIVGIGVLRDTSPGTDTFSSGADGSGTATMQDEATPAAPSAAASPGTATAKPEAEAGATARESAPPSDSASSSQSKAVPPSLSPVIPPAGGTGTGVATPSFGRKVEQTTRLSLTTSARKLQEVSDGVVRVTQDAGGVVQQSSVDTTDRGGTASFTLTVPSAKAQETVKRLSALAHVASMSQAATDITGSFVSAVDRLSDARAERRALLKALDAAKTPEGIARLRERIRGNRNEIAGLKGELARLRRRADTTVLSVTVTGRPGAVSGQDAGGGSWSAGDAARDAVRVLEVALGVLLVALAVVLPVGLLVVPASLGARVARRRRREHALDPA